MRIAVLGSGNVGGTLGRRWADAGHSVAFGVRDVTKGDAAVKGGDTLPAGSFVTTIPEALRDADVVLLATPWPAAADALRSAGPLAGQVVIDATNPLGPGFTLLHGPNGESGAEQLQAIVPGAHLVKAFNSTGYQNMASPAYDGTPTVMFYAGDDTNAKSTVRTLVQDIGFEAIDAGALVRSRELESLATLWIGLAYGGGMGRDFAFRVVRR
jgi:8-hydroxy-5-deazaflavin:NADPH oxidoreductase